jgi:hypothetical protein
MNILFQNKINVKAKSIKSNLEIRLSIMIKILILPFYY